MLRSYQKMNFYSTWKTDVSRSKYLDLIKNEQHHQAIAKLRSGNHKLRIETDRYHVYVCLCVYQFSTEWVLKTNYNQY